jgi:hypothetical protein
LADGLSEYTTAKHYAIWLSHYAWGQTLNDSTQRNPWSFFGWSTEAGADDYTTTHTGSRTFTRFPMPPGVYNWAQARFLDNGIGVVVFWTPNEYGRDAFVGTDVDDMNFSGVGTAGAHTFGTSGDADYMWDNVLSESLGLTFSAQAVSGTTSYSSLTSGTVQIDLLPSATGTLDLGSADVRWAEIHGNLDGPVTFRAKASSGTLAVGDVVYIDGVSGETPTVAKASASSSSTMPAFGVISQGGTAPAEVYVTTFGSLSGVALPAATYTIGQNVYVSTTAGEFTNTAPTGESNLIQNIGFVAKTHNTNGILKVGGAGRSNAVPNLNQDKIFLGNASNQAVPTALSSINLSKFNDDLPAVQDSYLMLIESPSVKAYTLDGSVTADRTITAIYAKLGGGTSATVDFKRTRSGTTVDIASGVAVTTTAATPSLSNTGLQDGDRLWINVSAISAPEDMEIVVEYTQ